MAVVKIKAPDYRPTVAITIDLPAGLNDRLVAAQETFLDPHTKKAPPVQYLILAALEGVFPEQEARSSNRPSKKGKKTA